MTRIFNNIGFDFPVTIVEAGPCEVTQIKSVEGEGYSSVQLGFIDKSKRHVNKSEKGHCDKAGVVVKKILKEFEFQNINSIEVGQKVNSDIFEIGDTVTVSGISKGKGFAGHMKRHNFSGGRASHGKNSVMRKAGSIGAGTSPGRVWKGTRMAGRMGNDTVTVKNLAVIKINNNENTIFLNGSIPGSKNSIVYISKAL